MQFAHQFPDTSIVAAVDPQLLQQRAKQLNIPFILHLYDSKKVVTGLQILPVNLLEPVTTGVPNTANNAYILQTLEIAARGCLQKQFRAMITGPVNKATMNIEGFAFSGHTEFLAQITQTQNPVMMLMTNDLKVALLTQHLPLRKVPDAITEKLIMHSIKIIRQDLLRLFQIENPRILVCGLNPHAGENGKLGDEEQTIIIPALNKLRAQNYCITGPVAADTAFTSNAIQQHDVILAMYHDQGLPVLKHHGFGEAVNITLGLPIIRTSVDHGTAYELAGTGKSDPGSFIAAIQLADKLSNGLTEPQG